MYSVYAMHSEAMAEGSRGHQPIPETDFRAGVEAALPDTEVEEAAHFYERRGIFTKRY